MNVNEIKEFARYLKKGNTPKGKAGEYIAEIMKNYAQVASEAEIWSHSMLSLHGILTGGDAPLNPVTPSWVDTADEEESLSEDEIIEVNKSKDKSAKLKLVFPDGDGKSQEFCINLTPEENGDK